VLYSSHDAQMLTRASTDYDWLIVRGVSPHRRFSIGLNADSSVDDYFENKMALYHDETERAATTY